MTDQKTEALKLVLLFHSAWPWSTEKVQQWNDGMDFILGIPSQRDCKIVGSYANFSIPDHRICRHWNSIRVALLAKIEGILK